MKRFLTHLADFLLIAYDLMGVAYWIVLFTLAALNLIGFIPVQIALALIAVAFTSWSRQILYEP